MPARYSTEKLYTAELDLAVAKKCEAHRGSAEKWLAMTTRLI
jgi:hypothetical protein